MSDDGTEYMPVKRANGDTVMARKTRSQKQRSKEKNDSPQESAASSQQDGVNGSDSGEQTPTPSQISKSTYGDEQDDDDDEASKASSRRSGGSTLDGLGATRKKMEHLAPLVFLGGPSGSDGGYADSTKDRYAESIARKARQAGYSPELGYSSGGPVVALAGNSNNMPADSKVAFAKYLGRKAQEDGYQPRVFRPTKDIDDDAQSRWTGRVTSIGEQDRLEEQLIRQEQILQESRAELARCRRAASDAQRRAYDTAEKARRQEEVTRTEQTRRDRLFDERMAKSKDQFAKQMAREARQRRNKTQSQDDAFSDRSGTKYSQKYGDYDDWDRSQNGSSQYDGGSSRYGDGRRSNRGANRNGGNSHFNGGRGSRNSARSRNSGSSYSQYSDN